MLPLRHPLHVAKAAASVAAASGGRFILGLGSGDRPAEYAAFGRRNEDRRELFRAHWDRVAAALADDGRVVPDLEAAPPTSFELHPHPPGGLPLLAVGSAGQSVEWIARHAIGWATYHRELPAQRERHRMWRAAVDRASPGAFRSFSVAMRVELLEDAGAPAQPLELGWRSGSRALVDLLQAHRSLGVHHAALNLSSSKRPLPELLAQFGSEVLPALRD